MSDSSAEIQALLGQGMGTHLHWFPGDAPPARLAAVMVGMANCQGGTLLLGIAPRSPQITGVAYPQAALDRVFQAALLVDPPLVLPLPEVLQPDAARSLGVSGGSVSARPVIRVVIPRGLPNVYSLDGRYLGRQGAQTNPLSARELRRLLLDRGVIQFEMLSPPDACSSDLDPEKIAAYLRGLDLAGEEPVDEVLLRRGCLRRAQPRSRAEFDGRATRAGGDNRGEELQPTYAGLLLFGRQPQRWLVGAGILAARFAGPTLTDEFIKGEFHGSLPEQLRLAESFIRDHLPSRVRLEGLEHRAAPIYPLEALREVLVNAVAHRDYNVQGDMIHINIFSDRIEIHSPGRLAGPMNLDNLLEARFSRNPVILQVLADMGFVERLGYGLNRVVEVMRAERLRPPRFEEVAGAFRVTLFAPSEPLLSDEQLGADLYSELGLNPRQQQAVVFMRRHRRITNRDYQELCPEVHPETLRRDLAGLVEHGLAIKVGDKRATYYILKNY